MHAGTLPPYIIHHNGRSANGFKTLLTAPWQRQLQTARCTRITDLEGFDVLDITPSGRVSERRLKRWQLNGTTGGGVRREREREREKRAREEVSGAVFLYL